jgi:hypothetical protein
MLPNLDPKQRISFLEKEMEDYIGWIRKVG